MSGLIRAVPESLSALDRGLAYGDGLFETLAVRNNTPCFWDEHMQRLTEGCSRLGIPCPDLSELKAGAEALCINSEGKAAVLKLIVTRGQGGRGYRFPDDAKPWIGMSLYHAPDYPSSYSSDGIRACICKTRLSTNPSLAGIKHLNRLEQVLARNEFGDDCQEGIMLDGTSSVIEGTMSNLFMISGQELITPEVDHCGVAGITRNRLIEWAGAEGIACQVTKTLGLEKLFAADALFVCNSVIGIWPVRQLENVTFSVKNKLLRQIKNGFPALCA